jgi:hypothetical protein
MAKSIFWGVLLVTFLSVFSANGALSTTAYSYDDTWLDEDNPTTNYGSNYYLHIFGRTSGGNNVPEENFLIRFTLPSLPSGYHIQSATVRMYYCDRELLDTGDRVDVGLYAVRPTRTWTENGATWYTMNGSSYWAQAGCESAAFDRYDTLLGTQSFYRSTAFGDKDFTSNSLAQTVRDWYSGALVNNGLVGRTYQHITGSEGVTFYSNDYGNSWGPRLIISYTLDPSASTGSGYSVGPGGTVQLNGTASYDRDGGSIVSWLWDLDNDGSYDDASGALVNVSYDYLVKTLGLQLGDNIIGIKVFDDENEWATAAGKLTIIPEPAAILLLALGTAALGKNRK